MARATFPGASEGLERGDRRITGNGRNPSLPGQTAIRTFVVIIVFHFE